MGKRTKYKTRPDGRRETTKTYKNFGPSRFSGKHHFYGRTDDEVDQKIEDFERYLNNLPAVSDEQKKENTFEHYAMLWWDRKEHELSPSTLKGYNSHYEDLVSEFGKDQVDQITLQQLTVYYRRLAKQDCSQKLIRNRWSVMRGIFEEAYDNGAIQQIPNMNLAKIKGKAAEKRPPASDDDVRRLEEVKDISNYSRLFYFMEYTGCRRGEAVAIQQKHIDRKNKKARIEQAVVYRTQIPEIKLPKTAAGIREVALLDNVLEILPEYKDPETYVFFPDGLPHETALRRGIERFREENDISATAHQLRHTYASMLHSANVSAKDAQQLLGHSSIVVTEDIYTSLESQYKRDLRDQINDYVLQERLGRGEKESCPECGNTTLSYPDGRPFQYCPDCGKKLPKSSKKSST